MNLLRRISEAYKILTKGIVSNVYGLSFASAQIGLVDRKGDKSKMLQSYVSWVYACVSIRAKAVSAAKFRLYVKRGVDEFEEVGEHPAIDLLRRVNPLDTFIDLKYITVAHLDLTGDAYWYMPKNGLGLPAEIWILPPDRVRIVPNEKTIVGGYVLHAPNGQRIQFDADEILHFKYPNPSDPLYGASPLMAVARSVDIDEFQHEFQRKFYKNYAIPPLALETEQVLTQEQVENLKTMWNRAYGGENVGKGPAVLDAGLKAHMIGMPTKDLQWLESNRVTRDDILAVYGVPASKLGLVEDVNRANAEANDYTFAVNVVEPILAMLDERLTQGLAAKYDEKLVFIHDSTVAKNIELETKLAQMRVSSGLRTINEERLADGWDAVEGGDVPLVPANLVPLNRVGQVGANFETNKE